MFHYFKIPYLICNLFTKFTYNEYIGPYFLLHVVLQFSPVNSPRQTLDIVNVFKPTYNFKIHNNLKLSNKLPKKIAILLISIFLHKK